jgi:hypothetical protein
MNAMKKILRLYDNLFILNCIQLFHPPHKKMKNENLTIFNNFYEFMNFLLPNNSKVCGSGVVGRVHALTK